MARYRITQPAFVGGIYYDAAFNNPHIIEIPDDIIPSVTWEMLDTSAPPNLSVVDPVDPVTKYRTVLKKRR